MALNLVEGVEFAWGSEVTEAGKDVVSVDQQVFTKGPGVCTWGSKIWSHVHDLPEGTRYPYSPRVKTCANGSTL